MSFPNQIPSIIWRITDGEVSGKKGNKKSEYIADVELGDKKYTITIHHRLGETKDIQNAIKTIVENTLRNCDRGIFDKMAGHKFKTDLNEGFDAKKIGWAGIQKPRKYQFSSASEYEERFERATPKIQALFQNIYNYKVAGNVPQEKSREAEQKKESPRTRLVDEKNKPQPPLHKNGPERSRSVSSDEDLPEEEVKKTDIDEKQFSIHLKELEQDSQSQGRIQRTYNQLINLFSRKIQQTPSRQVISFKFDQKDEEEKEPLLEEEKEPLLTDKERDEWERDANLP